MKFKEKLKNWLFKEELDEIKNIHDRLCVDEENIAAIKSTYDECLRKMNQSYREVGYTVNLHYKSNALLEDCRRLMNSICDVGTDIGFKDTDHSWAVICIHGKMDLLCDQLGDDEGRRRGAGRHHGGAVSGWQIAREKAQARLFERLPDEDYPAAGTCCGLVRWRM